MNGKTEDQASDLLIQEVDEDLRREHYLKLWQLYGKYAIATIIAIILGVAGHQVWLSWRDKQFQTEAARFQAAETMLAAGKQSEGMAALAAIAGGDHNAFAMMAGFRRAELQVEAGDLAGAAVSYETLGKTATTQEFRDLAVLKGAMLALDKDDPDLLAKRLQPLTDAGKPWRFTAREMLALLASRRGDMAMAASLYKRLADDADAPQAIRSRAAEMLTLLGGAPQSATPEKG